MEKMNESKHQQAAEVKERDWNDAIEPFYEGRYIGVSMGVSNDEITRVVADNELLELKTSDNVSLFVHGNLMTR